MLLPVLGLLDSDFQGRRLRQLLANLLELPILGINLSKSVRATVWNFLVVI